MVRSLSKEKTFFDTASVKKNMFSKQFPAEKHCNRCLSIKLLVSLLLCAPQWVQPVLAIFPPLWMVVPSEGSADHFTITHLNCQGLLNKFDMLVQMMRCDWRNDMVWLREAWLRSTSFTDSYLNISDLSLFRRDRPHWSHRWLLKYLCSFRNARKPTDLERDDIKCQTIELYSSTNKSTRF